MNDKKKPSLYSCEFFPPRTEKGMENLLRARSELRSCFDPAFYSVTFGAGGTTRDRTLDTVDALLESGSTNIAPHISCIGSTKDEISDVLATYSGKGLHRLVTLRGDIPEGDTGSNELKHANELVSFIRETTGDTFHIEVAAYPEFHPESSSPGDDLHNFKRKVDAGADSAITQYFYNTDAFYHFRDNCQSLGIDIPIVPGIMPITNAESLIRFSDRCGAEIPRWIRKYLEEYSDDEASLREFGTDVVSRLCNDLLDNDVTGLHFYTLNRSAPVIDIWNNLEN